MNEAELFTLISTFLHGTMFAIWRSNDGVNLVIKLVFLAMLIFGITVIV